MTDISLAKNKQYLDSIVFRLKKGIDKACTHRAHDKALSLISACANILYRSNQCYSDPFLEEALCGIAQQLLPEQAKTAPWDKNRILFYDGFGLNDRGLIRIYLTGLCKLGRVIYVTDNAHKDALPDVLNILHQANADIVWLQERKPTAAIHELHRIFQQYQPGTAFLYTRPDDVVSTAVFSRLEGQVTRFQINLTDHSYWLGTCALDYCIEFRDYGAVASSTGRGISPEKLVKLPFYPVVDRKKAFDGYPFPFDPSHQKLIFSGGALYKTLGGGDLYYALAEHILDTYPEAVFWYAGSGNRARMDKLLRKYPGRAFLTEERRDLHQVLQHSFFYLSTYPITGGLMFQYAAAAGKLPITLKFDSEADGYLLGQSQLGIEATDMEQAKQLIHRIFTDPVFREKKEAQVSRSVLTQAAFEQQLGKLIATGASDYPIAFYDVDVTDLRREYLSAIDLRTVASTLAKKEFIAAAPYLPLEFAAGAVKILRDKLLRRKRK